MALYQFYTRKIKPIIQNKSITNIDLPEFTVMALYTKVILYAVNICIYNKIIQTSIINYDNKIDEL